MSEKLSARTKGFSIAETILILLLATTLALGGWYIWHSKQSKTISRQQSTLPTQEADKIGSSAKMAQPTIQAGWTWYENKDMGLKFAYPKTWTVGTPMIVKTTKDDQGWVVTLEPLSRQNGDPAANFTTYPSSASIKDVDAGIRDVKLQNITTGDKKEVTLFGTIEDQPGASTKPAQMYASSCWPRHCTPKLANGRFWSIAVSAANNDPNCQAHSYCPSELNMSGENYAIFLAILKTVTSL